MKSLSPSRGRLAVEVLRSLPRLPSQLSPRRPDAPLSAHRRLWYMIFRFDTSEEEEEGSGGEETGNGFDLLMEDRSLGKPQGG